MESRRTTKTEFRIILFKIQTQSKTPAPCPCCTIFILFDLLCCWVIFWLLWAKLDPGSSGWLPFAYFTIGQNRSPHRSLICCISCLYVFPIAFLAEYHVNASCLDFGEVKNAILLKTVLWQEKVNCECDHWEWKGKLHHPCNKPALWIMINHSLRLPQSPVNV